MGCGVGPAGPGPLFVERCYGPCGSGAMCCMVVMSTLHVQGRVLLTSLLRPFASGAVRGCSLRRPGPSGACVLRSRGRLKDFQPCVHSALAVVPCTCWHPGPAFCVSGVDAFCIFDDPCGSGAASGDAPRLAYKSLIRSEVGCTSRPGQSWLTSHMDIVVRPPFLTGCC